MYVFDLKQDRVVANAHRLRKRTKQFAQLRKIQRHKKMALLRGSFTLEEETR